MLLKHTSCSGLRAIGCSRRTSVGVYNVFSLGKTVRGIAAQRSGPTRQALAMEAPASAMKLSPRKSIQGVPVNQRETVELIMALTNLDSKPTSALVSTVQHLPPLPHMCCPTSCGQTQPS
jgi:hypothetical protein